MNKKNVSDIEMLKAHKRCNDNNIIIIAENVWLEAYKIDDGYIDDIYQEDIFLKNKVHRDIYFLADAIDDKIKEMYSGMDIFKVNRLDWDTYYSGSIIREYEINNLIITVTANYEEVTPLDLNKAIINYNISEEV